LTFLFIFISGDRTPLILFIISSILILFLFKAKVLHKLIFSFILIILFSTLLISNENLYNRIINKTLVEFGSEKGLASPETDRLTYFTYKGKQINFMAQQQVYMFISINMFKEKPFFGHGPRAFKTLSCDEKYKITQWSCSSHPHNFYLQLLSESGILGFIILFYFFCYITFILAREILSKKKNLSFELHLLIIAMFINLFPLTQTGNFFGNWNSILIYLPVGFYFGILKKNQNKKNFT
jgi:O-antigen ligase